MLPIHKDVLEAYLSELGDRRDWLDNGWFPVQNFSVEFNGTITEARTSAPSERIVVARWSVDLIGRISIKLLATAQSGPESATGRRSVDRPLEEGEAFVDRPAFSAA